MYAILQQLTKLWAMGYLGYGQVLYTTILQHELDREAQGHEAPKCQVV